MWESGLILSYILHGNVQEIKIKIEDIQFILKILLKLTFYLKVTFSIIGFG